MIKMIISLFAVITLLTITGCQAGNPEEEASVDADQSIESEEDNGEEVTDDTLEDTDTEVNGGANEEDNTEDSSGREDVDVTVVDSVSADAPEDQGDLHVRWDIHVEEQEDTFIFTGETNLLPETRVRAMIKSDDYTFIGYHEYARIENDGTFYVEVPHPQKYDTELELYVEMTTFQDPEISEHYGEFLENVEGPLVYIDHNSAREDIHHIVKTHMFFVPVEGEYVTLQSETPEWDFPEDQGNLEVRISDVKVERDEDRFYISGKTNLIEPALVNIKLDLPEYISFGYQNSFVVNPDGSFETRLRYPDDIREDAEMNILIEFKPANIGQMDMITEHYGEEGENLQGDLVEKESSGDSYYVKLKLNVN
ncbi:MULTISPECIES: hypothetical protein [Bacillaceae]|uniref:Uncharacterized protein n=1 Tax=Evansella alkalicola TaxID=745819 RepID=A0ABS6JXN4_9BACI|nr:MULTISPECIES: hypothetical protein [Bacillaceae]MBU9723350.1 hypothetical protein [Bacillus alkalicola]